MEFRLFTPFSSACPNLESREIHTILEKFSIGDFKKNFGGIIIKRGRG
jgi:hypothetical protein